MNIHLAKILIKEDIVGLDQLRAAFEEQRRSGKGLGEVLISLGYMDESRFVDFLSKEYGVPAVNLDEFEIEAAVLKLVPRKTVLEHGLIPIAHSGSSLVLAMSDPSNIIAVDDLRFATGFNIKPVVAPARAINAAIGKYYGIDELEERAKIDRDEEPLEDIIRELEDFKNSVQKDNEASASQGDDLEQAVEETRSGANEGEAELIPSSILPENDDSDQQAEAVSKPAEDEVIANPFAAPSSSQNYKAADGHEGVIPEKAPEEDFNPISFFSEDDVSERQPEEAKLELKRAEEPFEPFVAESLARGQSQPQAEAVSESAEDEVIVNPFVAPSSSQNYGAVDGHEGVVSEKVPEEDFNPISFFSEDDVCEQQPEEANSETLQEARQEEGTLKQTSSHSGSFEFAQRLGELNNDVALELVEEEGVFEPFVTSSSLEHELTGHQWQVSPELAQDSHDFEPRSIFPEKPFFDKSSTTELIEKEEKQEDTPGVIPLRRDKECQTPTELEEGKEQGCRQTILVVDDSPTIQKIVAITLERKGYQVIAAANAMQAMAKLNEVVPTLIFLDIGLPHVDGYQVCKIIKANDLTKNIPVVMLSGKDGFFDKVRGRIAGATGYIAKPFGPSTLIEAVEKFGG
jgi:CheY-like chemotaxis protein